MSFLILLALPSLLIAAELDEYDKIVIFNSAPYKLARSQLGPFFLGETFAAESPAGILNMASGGTNIEIIFNSQQLPWAQIRVATPLAQLQGGVWDAVRRPSELLIPIDLKAVWGQFLQNRSTPSAQQRLWSQDQQMRFLTGIILDDNEWRLERLKRLDAQKYLFDLKAIVQGFEKAVDLPDDISYAKDSRFPTLMRTVELLSRFDYYQNHSPVVLDNSDILTESVHHFFSPQQNFYLHYLLLEISNYANRFALQSKSVATLNFIKQLLAKPRHEMTVKDIFGLYAIYRTFELWTISKPKGQSSELLSHFPDFGGYISRIRHEAQGLGLISRAASRASSGEKPKEKKSLNLIYSDRLVEPTAFCESILM